LLLCLLSTRAWGEGLLSVPGDRRSRVAVELKALDEGMLGEVEANEGSTGREEFEASGLSAPADAIIWGESKLVGLAKLPFRECWMPCTMLVWRLCVLDSASLGSGDRRGAGLGTAGDTTSEAGVADVEIDEVVVGVRADNGGGTGDVGFEVIGFTVALHASRVMGEMRRLTKRSGGRSGEGALREGGGLALIQLRLRLR
jgi:hypothetical protein